MRRSTLFVVSIAAATAASAQPNLGWEELAPPPAGGLTEAGARTLRAHVEGGIDAELRWADFRDLRPDLERFYAERGWTLAWVRDGRPTDAAWHVEAAFAAAARKALDPQDYGAERLEARLAAADRGGASEPERVRLDVALTVAAHRFVSDLALGRIRPVEGMELLGRFELVVEGAPSIDPVALVSAAAEAVDPAGVLERAEPRWPEYRRALGLLTEYLALQADEVPTVLPPPGDEGSAPERYLAREELTARLAWLGDLPEGWESVAADGESVCASPLAEALARFQSRHGLEPSGFVDEATVRELNVPILRRVAQLQLSLERWRWMPRLDPDEALRVNVPEFRLVAGAERSLSMRVVVGQAYRSGTPVLAARMARVVVRPPWKVPLGIQVRDLVPRIAANRRFLAASGLEVLDATESPIPPMATPELLAGLRRGALRLRQRPGPANALGLVKFDFSNADWIYLHDTPATELFARSRRDFSHGCVRVEDPVALAAWVLRGEPGWTPAAIRRAMQGAVTVEVPVTRPVPVLVGYFTAVVNEDGVPRFLDDIYGQDAALAQALAEEARRRGAP